MRFRIIPLEERILLDAAAMVDVSHLAHQQQQQQQAAQAHTAQYAHDATSHDHPEAVKMLNILLQIQKKQKIRMNIQKLLSKTTPPTNH